jgi:pyrroline-5-carboxylate reductase
MKALGECRLPVVGVGLLGGLLVDRLLTCGECVHDQIIACESDPERRAEIAEWAGVAASEDNRRAAEAGVIILAVPPGQVIPVLEALAPRLTPEHLVVSTAAAVPLAAMERAAGEGVPVVRALPNSPALVGQGMTPVCYGRAVTPGARALAERLLACWGEGVQVPEAQMNLCVGLTAAAPTYFFPVIAALVQAGVAGGLEREAALRLAAGVVRGSGALALETGQSPAALMALTPLQPLREPEAKALFVEAVQNAAASADGLQSRLGL